MFIYVINLIAIKVLNCVFILRITIIVFLNQIIPMRKMRKYFTKMLLYMFNGYKIKVAVY